jgi:hypothetical protein
MAISCVGCDHDGKSLQRLRPGGVLAGPVTGPLGADRVPTARTTAAALGAGLAGGADLSGIGDALEASWLASGAVRASVDPRTHIPTADLSAAVAWTGAAWRGAVPARKSAGMPIVAKAAHLSGNAVLMAQDMSAVRETATFARIDQAQAPIRRHVRSRGPSQTEPPA